MAEACALGTITKRKESMSSENMICMTYCKKAMRAPTCISPLSMRMPPNQMIAMDVKLITISMTGKRKATNLPTLIVVAVKSKLASLKRGSSARPS